ncbi:MAG: hypothetical protein KY432_02665 [Acidobacteria bacterium]|nr:hypothetical protein [Acidobacteriota bacterium]
MKRFALLLLALLLSLTLSAQQTDWYEKTKIGFVGFGDYYYVAESHDEEIEGENGLWFRRIYLTFDHKFDDKLSARLRFEANHPGDFESSGELEPFIKDAWVKYRVSDGHAVVAGIQPTPAFSAIEDFWGYRSLEKTPNDLFRINSSRDFGIAAQGAINDSGSLQYHAMFGNGSGVANEINQDKYFGAAVSFAPSDAIFVQVYADNDSRPGDADRSTLQGFAGFSGDRWRGGIHYLTQQRNRPAGDHDVSLASLFGIYELSETMTLIGRLDHSFDPIPDVSRIAYVPVAPGADVNFLLVGLDVQLHPNAGIIPNIEYLSYDGAPGANPDDDILPRLTFYLKF